MSDIMNRLKEMCKYELGDNIENIKECISFYVNDVENKVIVKNYNDEIDIIDIIGFNFKVNNYEYLQQFQYCYSFNDCEIIEFDLD